MKIILSFLILCLSFYHLAAQEQFMMHNGYNRAYLVHVPPAYDGSTSYPLIFVFHGLSGSDSALFRSGFNERSEIMKYIVVYPTSIKGGWNSHDNDIDFVSVLLDTLQKKFHIDSKRVYATGHSDGAFFCYTLGSKLPEKFAAIAPVAGYWTGSSQTIPSPKPVLAIHAVDDATVPYSTDQAGLAAWRQKNQCSATPDTVYNYVGTIAQLWRSNAIDADVEFVTYAHGGHTWLFYPIDCTDLVVDFFYNHPKRERKITLTSPINLIYDTPANIQFSTNVESDTPATKVEYFLDSTKIGESSTPPFIFNWNNVTQNEYLIHAKVSFTDGTSEISSNFKKIDVLLPNVALNKPCEYSAYSDNTVKASFAFDGDLTTRWSSPYKDPQWLSVDLQGIYRIKNVTLIWGTSYGLDYTIDVSSDKQLWTAIYATSKSNGGTEFLSVPPTEARYVRWHGNRRGTPYGYSLWEIQVNGEFVHAVSVSNSHENNQRMNLSSGPNPYPIGNSDIIIRYTLPVAEQVEIDIYNVIGQKMCGLINGVEKNGEHTLRWDCQDENNRALSSGIYICRLKTPYETKSCKIILMK